MPKLHAYKSLEVFNLSKKLTVACYALAHDLPAEEKTSLGQQLRNAALTVYIQVTQGAFVQTKGKKKKYIRTAQSALMVIDALLEILIEVGFAKEEQTNEIIRLSSACYQLLEQL